MDKIKLYSFYEQIGDIYVNSFLLPSCNDDRFYGLYTFLKNYAYERQGGNAVYPYVASELIKKWCEGNSTEQCVTEEFKTELEEYKKYKDSNDSNDVESTEFKGLNEKRNPLYDGSEKSKSIMEFMNKNGKRPLKEILGIDKEDGVWDVKVAYDKIKEINGIGNKIASFYLRDLKEFHILNGKKIKIVEGDRWLLQPIDIWVRRIVKGHVEKDISNDQEIAKGIVDSSLKNELNPERVNMGMWFFGSNIIGNRYKLYTLYKQQEYEEFRKCVEEYSKKLSTQLKSIANLTL